MHAVGNTFVLVLYAASWRSRRRSRIRGVMWGLAGGSLAWATGYLGGHLSFARGVGVGPRGLTSQDAGERTPAAGEDVSEVRERWADMRRVIDDAKGRLRP